MGIDLVGWIEVKENDTWYGVVQAWPLIGRNVYMYGFVLGAWKAPHEASIVEQRGMPPDPSEDAKEDYAEAYAAQEQTRADSTTRAATGRIAEHLPEYDIRPSWVTWKEITTFDWERADGLLYAYEHDAQGRLVDPQRIAYHPKLEALAGITWDDVKQGRYAWQEGQEWQVDGTVFRVEKIRRGDPRIADWDLLFDMMCLLAQKYGDEHVRLVAWFEY